MLQAFLTFSEKLEELERLLAGARTGIEKMQGHLQDDSFEAEKVSLFIGILYCLLIL